MHPLRRLRGVVSRHVQRCALPVPPFSVARRACATSGTKWTCSCGFSNYGFHQQCFSCNAPRKDAAAATTPSPAMLLHNAPQINVEDAKRKVAEERPVVPAEGVWMCPACNTFNNAVRGACVHCHSGRPAPRHVLASASPATASGFSATSEPPSPSTINSSKQQPFKRGDWYCACGAHNFARNRACRDCHAPAPLQSREGPRGVPSSSRNDWVCRECGKYNYGYRTACMRCNGPPPPGSSRDAPETSGGRRADTDDVAAATAHGWVCQACHSMNPAEARTACVICGTPKN